MTEPMNRSDISQLRLYNQGVANPSFSRPDEVVDWLVAVQAQDYYGAQWALGIRMQNPSETALEAAMTAGTILRTHVLRPTWHFVTPADIRWLLALTAPRVHQASGTMYRQLDLDEARLKRSQEVLAAALQGGRQLTRDGLREALEEAGIGTDSGLRTATIVMAAELDGIICSGARRGKQFTYALLEERAPQAHRLERAEALAELTRRFFTSRGPATEYDFAKWSGLTVSDARRGLEMVGDQLEHVDLDGQAYWFVPPALPERSALPPEAHLLSIFDEYISSYKDHTEIAQVGIWEKLVALGNGLRNIIVLDGQVVGKWKRSLGKGMVTVETVLYKPVNEVEQQAIVRAAERYAVFLGRSLIMSGLG